MAHTGAWHIPSLDGLRGLSVLLVLSSHTLQSAQLRDVIPGSFGVTVFFFLSGYLITTLLRVEVEDTGSIAFGKFYLRRALRIFPPFYLVLLLAALRGHYGVLIHTANHMEWSYVLGQALQLTNYLQIYFPTEHLAPGTDIFWSLAVEEHFYLLFPWIFLWLARLEEPRKRAAVLLAACALVLLWRCYLEFVLQSSYNRTYCATDTRIDSILFGCTLALWGNPVLDSTRISENAWKHWLFPLSLAGLALSFGVTNPSFADTARYTLQGVCLVAVFVVAIRYPDWGPMRPLNSRLLSWIGLISYSLYLLHLSVLKAVYSVWGHSIWVLLCVGWVASIGLAAAIYYAIERPAGRLRKRLSAHPVQQPLRPPGNPATVTPATEA
ncbi:MAG: acyltransferase 3 [Gammaproteobacteria bacterium]|nr:acyltransferase 3 [Gammaproteobacteria bacterium]